MIEPNEDTKTGIDSVTASDLSAAPQPIPNSAAAVDSPNSPPLSINPDDMHNLFEGVPGVSGLDDEDPLAQLRNDPNYSALIRDLEYIASQARLLFAPAEEAPSDELWGKIQSQLPGKPEE